MQRHPCPATGVPTTLGNDRRPPALPMAAKCCPGTLWPACMVGQGTQPGPCHLDGWLVPPWPCLSNGHSAVPCVGGCGVRGEYGVLEQERDTHPGEGCHCWTLHPPSPLSSAQPVSGSG